MGAVEVLVADWHRLDCCQTGPAHEEAAVMRVLSAEHDQAKVHEEARGLGIDHLA